MMARGGALLAGILLAGGSVVARGSSPAEQAGPLVVAQVPAGAALAPDALADGTLRAPVGEGGRIVRVDSSGRIRVLTEGFESAADPDVSFDGKHVLFAGRRTASDPWCAWEMTSEGGDPRRITCGKAGVRHPVYQTTIYTITPTTVEPWVQIAFVGEDPGEINEAGVAPNTSLWSCKTDGSALRRLTYNLSNDLDPVILPDGRMIYAGWLRGSADRGPEGRFALLGVNEDGTDYQVYAGDEGLRVKQMPTPTASGLVVFVEADRIAGDGSGRLAAVSQHRPLHTYRPLTREADGLFRAPSPLPDGRVLVAWRPGPGQGTFGIYRFDPATGAREKLFTDASWHSVAARLLAPRPRPDDRSSVVRDNDASGKLYTLDVGINDLGPGLPEGWARRLRLVEGVPAPDHSPTRRLLGVIPLAEDGSYQVQVPANTPIQLQLLDADGLAVRTSAWLWVRNHGQQGCIGCHEDPERTPPNRFVNALAQPAPVLDLPPDRRRTPGYAAEVEPVVKARCLACHGEGGREPRLDAGVAALRPWIVPGEARRSRLVWHLLGRNTARPWDPEAGLAAHPMPADAQPLTPEEIQAFLEWIDLGGQP
jgi:Tol biopolymer transport system component/mono/diheme cytochrome c family protein